jgi:hypothetical protein
MKALEQQIYESRPVMLLFIGYGHIYYSNNPIDIAAGAIVIICAGVITYWRLHHRGYINWSKANE